jgi:large subunit ribosomal protein L6
MSRVGKAPIRIPPGVEVRVEGSVVRAKGPKGELEKRFHPDMRIRLEDGVLRVERPSDHPRHRALHGLTRALLANMVEGVAKGFEKTLEIVGVGYRAEAKGAGLQFHLGFSHPVVVTPPPGVKVVAETPTLVKVSGPDKELVGRVAAEIRALRPPEPYKGKGIRYQGEAVRRKAGKTGATTA